MFRVDTSTAADSAPAPSPAGTPGYFRSGNPQAGIPATIPGADWFNTMQEELAGLVEHYGFTLDKTDRTQLRQAIEAAIAAATLRYDIASRSQAEAGTDNVALMTPLRVAQAVNALSARSSLASRLNGLANELNGCKTRLSSLEQAVHTLQNPPHSSQSSHHDHDDHDHTKTSE